jgi:hypothetical protein
VKTQYTSFTKKNILFNCDSLCENVRIFGKILTLKNLILLKYQFDVPPIERGVSFFTQQEYSLIVGKKGIKHLMNIGIKKFYMNVCTLRRSVDGTVFSCVEWRDSALTGIEFVVSAAS